MSAMELNGNAEQNALNDPRFDYFAHTGPEQPKKTIGMYVKSKGFDVPVLIEEGEIRAAIETETAFIRSELIQDYDGLGGQFSSASIDSSIFDSYPEDRQQAMAKHLDNLKSGLITPKDYMFTKQHGYSWSEEAKELYDAYHELEILPNLNWLSPTASVWRRIDGTNVSIFRDPHVDGRYHFGVTPFNQAIGGYMVEADEHTKPQQFRKHRQPFVAEPFIDLYEQIRELPLFDTSQVPVMEMVQDDDGKIHWLQYRKVGKTLDLLDPFDVERVDGDFLTNDVRGITLPEGKEFTIVVNPTELSLVSLHKAIFADVFYMNDRIELKNRFQIACRMAELAICQDSLSFKDNHTSSAPLYSSDLALSLVGYTDKSGEELFMRFWDDPRLSSIGYPVPEDPPLLDVKVTSNGRVASVTSNWEFYQSG